LNSQGSYTTLNSFWAGILWIYVNHIVCALRTTGLGITILRQLICVSPCGYDQLRKKIIKILDSAQYPGFFLNLCVGVHNQMGTEIELEQVSWMVKGIANKGFVDG